MNHIYFYCSVTTTHLHSAFSEGNIFKVRPISNQYCIVEAPWTVINEHQPVGGQWLPAVPHWLLVGPGDDRRQKMSRRPAGRSGDNGGCDRVSRTLHSSLIGLYFIMVCVRQWRGWHFDKGSRLTIHIRGRPVRDQSESRSLLRNCSNCLQFWREQRKVINIYLVNPNATFLTGVKILKLKTLEEKKVK